jgi:hypothetical protein
MITVDDPCAHDQCADIVRIEIEGAVEAETRFVLVSAVIPF